MSETTSCLPITRPGQLPAFIGIHGHFQGYVRICRNYDGSRDPRLGTVQSCPRSSGQEEGDVYRCVLSASQCTLVLPRMYVSAMQVDRGLTIIAPYTVAFKRTIQKLYPLAVISILQGLGGGGIVLKARNLAFISDSSSRPTRPVHFSLIYATGGIADLLVARAWTPYFATENFHLVFLASQVCWIIYLLYLTFIIQEAKDDYACPTSGVAWFQSSFNSFKLFFDQRRALLLLPSCRWPTLCHFLR